MKKISAFIASANSLLENYTRTANYIMALTDKVRQHLPKPLQLHCQVANYRDGILIVQTDNAAWATQLRYILPEVQTRLQTYPEFKALNSIRYFVRPAKNAAEKALTNPITLSAENAQILSAAAEHIAGSLGAKLKKIAQRSVGTTKNDAKL